MTASTDPKPLLLNMPLSRIAETPRLRPLDDAYVTTLAESMRQTGLHEPVVLRPFLAGQMQIVAGAHRHAAAKRLGWDTIPALVREDLNEATAMLVEIDENLIRHELNPLDRAVFLAERKKVYELLHPETRAGVAGGKARAGSAMAIFAFADDTAERTRLSARTVRRAVQLAQSLTAEERSRIAGTWLAQREGDLFRFAQLPPPVRRMLLGRLFPRDVPAPDDVRTLADGLKLIGAAEAPTPVDPETRQYQALLSAWSVAGREARQRFLDNLRTTGDLPEVHG